VITTAARMARLAPVARTVAWPALLAGAMACVTVILLSSLGDSARSSWPGLGALALCTGAAFLFDDPAAATVGATPRSLARRRMLRVAVALPLLCVVWAGSLWYATAAHDAWFGPDTRAALSVQFAAMLALTLAASATALRVLPDEQGGWTGVVVLFALLGAAYVLPQRWTLFAVGGDRTWAAVQHRWAALLALGVCALVWASSDPAARRRVRCGRA
jgi:fluoroquinolone transport system permease protein